MKSQQHSLLFLATTLLVTLPSHSGFAFSIGPQPPADYIYSRAYTKDLENKTGTIVGTVSLDAWPRWDPRRYGIFQGKVLPIRRGGTNGLLRLLSRRFPNWEFRRGRDIGGSFDIQRYRVCSPISPFPNGLCGTRANGTVRENGVGAPFRLNYNPRPSDPQGENIHWIQRFISNLTQNNNDVDLIDIRPGQTDPFYDTFGNADPTFFSDVPWDERFYLNRFFYAETYIVKEIFSPPNTGNPSIVKRKVEIYNGVRWGFENQQRCIPSSGGGGCVLPSTSTRTVSANVHSQGLDNNSTENFALDNASLTMEDADMADISGDLLEDPELASEDNNSVAFKTTNPDDDALPAEAVPEPTTELGTLLALTGLGIFLKLKNRKTQK
jgi:hypothetical protein